jgi:hypothetical protein
MVLSCLSGANYKPKSERANHATIESLGSMRDIDYDGGMGCGGNADAGVGL